MKTKLTLLVIACLSLCLHACKKDNTIFRHPTNGNGRVNALSTSLDTAFTVTPASASIIGKWYETRERIQVKTSGVGQVADTVYYGPAFDQNDYFLFRSDSTAYLQQKGIFSVTGIGSVHDGAGNIIYGKADLVYHITGANLGLQNRYPIPTPMVLGTNVRTITQLDAHNLMIHDMYTIDNSITVTDTNYIR